MLNSSTIIYMSCSCFIGRLYDNNASTTAYDDVKTIIL